MVRGPADGFGRLTRSLPDRLVVESTSLPASEAIRLGSRVGSDFLQAKQIGHNSSPCLPSPTHGFHQDKPDTWPLEYEVFLLLPMSSPFPIEAALHCRTPFFLWRL